MPIAARIHGRLADVAVTAWRRLDGADNPFLDHAFLTALESSSCVGAGTGWIPQHVTLWEGSELVAAAPAYLKSHSFGEFVFDWAWASAYRQHGLAYYPKLVCAVPFAPVAGPRLLVRSGAPQMLKAQLANAALQHARAIGASGVHWLFPDAEDTQLMIDSGLMLRKGCQFHWHNNGYAHFDDYLQALTAKKRKNIKRERRLVADAGITVTIRDGTELKPATWQRFYDLYHATTLRKGGTPYLTPTFFSTLGRTMGASVLLVTAHRHGDLVAGALCLRNQLTLYGRNWGCAEQFDGLHFETCYYAPIEYCIAHRLHTFEAGAQGEHKLARGFLPQVTTSAHWIENDLFRPAIERFVQQEGEHVEAYMDDLNDHTPFRGT